MIIAAPRHHQKKKKPPSMKGWAFSVEPGVAMTGNGTAQGGDVWVGLLLLSVGDVLAAMMPMPAAATGKRSRGVRGW